MRQPTPAIRRGSLLKAGILMKRTIATTTGGVLLCAALGVAGEVKQTDWTAGGGVTGSVSAWDRCQIGATFFEVHKVDDTSGSQCGAF